MTSSVKHLRAFAVIAVAICLISVIPIGDVSADSDSYYRYVIHPDGTVEGNYTPIGTSSSTGSYTSVNGANSGSWAFDEDGYGPFGSFYAAFNPAQNNRMIGHLNPDDLTRLVDGTSIAGQRYNVMWCLPTVYWLTDSNGNLILTDNPDAGGTAYAHTIDGHVYSYIGIGVYEASIWTVHGKAILTSFTEMDPRTATTPIIMRGWANNQLVNTSNDETNGCAMLWNFYRWQLYRFCAVSVMGSWNSQSVAGTGSFNYNRFDGYAETTGQLDSSGPYAGDKTTGSAGYCTPVKVFIENAWGSTEEYVDGVVIDSLEYYIDQSAVPTGTTSGTYITNPNGKLPLGSTGVYAGNPSTETQIWGMPTSMASTPLLYDAAITTNDTGTRIMLVGGAPTTTDSIISVAQFGGISAINCSYVGTSSIYVGSRLAFVFDDDPFQPQTHTVTFSTGSGTSIPSQIIESGSTALTPSNPTLEGYVFDCWSTSPTSRVPYDFNTPVTQDITLYAVWVETLVFTTTPVSHGQVSAVPRMAGTVLCDATGSRDYTSLLWDLGDGTLSTDNYVTHYYSEPGTYTVTLTTYNSQGADVTIFTVEVPEAPGGEDGDGLLLWLAVGLLILLIVAVVLTRIF